MEELKVRKYRGEGQSQGLSAGIQNCDIAAEHSIRLQRSASTLLVLVAPLLYQRNDS